MEIMNENNKEYKSQPSKSHLFQIKFLGLSMTRSMFCLESEDDFINYILLKNIYLQLNYQNP